MRGRAVATEKAKDFKGTLKKLIKSLGNYKIPMIIIFVFAILSTVFSIIGPKILGNAITEIFNGLIAKITGTGGIDFGKIAGILITLLVLYLLSLLFSFIQGIIMTNISQRYAYKLRKQVSIKMHKVPISYYDKKTHGEVLSLLTNDIDLLGQNLNQSATQFITSIVTLLGILVMMLSINVTITILVVIVLPIAAFITSKIVKRSQKYFIRQQNYLAKVNGDVEEAYSVSLEEGLTGAGFILDKGLKQHYLDYIRAEEAKIDWKKYNHVTPPRIVECTLDEGLIRRKAEETDMAMITIGRNAGEYSDRKVKDDFELCADEREMLEKVTRIFHQEGKKVVVILNIGGVIETASWKDRPDAILLAWQGGQEGGNSVADILSGKVNPSGKLPMTFPVRYEDAASSENFPLIGDEEALDIYREFYTGPKGTDRPNIDFTRYEEGIYVGYRYFDKYRVDVSYPFGFGLSYTGFTYSKPRYLRTEQGYEFSCTVTNTGKIPGKEVVQLYIAAPGKTMVKPQKELKAFAKTKILAPGESEVVRLVVGLSELASFDEQASCWAVESGRYLAIWGSSSRDCRLKQSFTLRQAVTGEEVHRVLLPVRQLEELY